MKDLAKGLILLIDDEPDILELLQFNLEKNGYRVLTAQSGEGGLEILKTDTPDLIVLDLMLPGMDGFEVAKIIKSDQSGNNIPIIMLTAKGEEIDVVIGLELGADDYVTKPFSPRILIARIKSILRRKAEKNEEDNSRIIRFNNLEINPTKFQARIKGEKLKLTFTEFSLLNFLASKPGWVFSRYQIVDALKGEDYIVTERSVDVQVAGLRKKLGKYGSLIETVRGVGYRFKDSNS